MTTTKTTTQATATTTIPTITDKTTRREMLTYIIEFIDNSKDANPNKGAYVEYLNHQIELLDKKAHATPKDTSKEGQRRIENKRLATEVLAILVGSGEKLRIKTIQELSTNEAIKSASTSKISALLKILIADNKVERIEEKKVVYFKAVKVTEPVTAEK
jgi:hypothetical protein